MMGVLILILYLLCLLGVCLSFNRFLLMLMMMEFVVISLLMVMTYSGKTIGFYLLYMLILGVCEGIMGLLVLLYTYRFWGFDGYQLFDYDLD